jgi:hypothetical protein
MEEEKEGKEEGKMRREEEEKGVRWKGGRKKEIGEGERRDKKEGHFEGTSTGDGGWREEGKGN